MVLVAGVSSGGENDGRNVGETSGATRQVVWGLMKYCEVLDFPHGGSIGSPGVRCGGERRNCGDVLLG